MIFLFRLLDKGSYKVTASPPLPPSSSSLCAASSSVIYYNKKTDIILNAFGGLNIFISVEDKEWDWDDGACDFEQWLKRQSAYPDDDEIERTLPAE